MFLYINFHKLNIFPGIQIKVLIIISVFATIWLTPLIDYTATNNYYLHCMESLLPGFLTESADRRSEKDNILPTRLYRGQLISLLWQGGMHNRVSLPSDQKALNFGIYPPLHLQHQIPISLVRYGLIPWYYSCMFDFLVLVSKSISKK